MNLYSSVLNVTLANILGENNIEIVACTPSTHRGTFPAQIVTCKLSNNQVLNLLCKYAPHGSKRYWSIEYEGKVYKNQINNIPFSKIKFYGTCILEDCDKIEECLILEYLNDSEQIINVEPSVFVKAAEWIAAFHNYFESQIIADVKVYDKEYYLLLVEAISILAERLESKFDLLLDLCAYFRYNIALLTEAPQTLIHGEYYGKNILIKNGIIYPVDWETAAKAPGEIDLAALIDRKDPLRTNYAIESYKAARWKNKQIIPREFEQRLLMAKIFYQFKWIVDWGIDSSELSKWLSNSSYYNQLFEIGKQADCI